MNKTVISLMIIIGSVLTCANMMAAAMKETPDTATIVTTKRRDVHRTIGLLGQLAYADEQILLSEVSGNINEVCVSPGERLAAGSIVVSYDGLYQEELAAFYTDHVVNASADMEALISKSIEQTVQRTTKDCTVREVYIQQGTPVTAGMPLVRVSGATQELRCFAIQADAENIVPGMWSWISHRGNQIGQARVKSVVRFIDEANMIGNQFAITLVPDQHIELEEGATLDVSIYVSGSDDVVSLPIEAITDRDTVWWINDEGRCTEIPAEIVMCDETYAWVNLPEGIQVAVGEFYEGQLVTGAST